ncbi:MAG: hypothetical protein ACR2Q3_13935 [Woeseiaceae bacterium]
MPELELIIKNADIATATESFTGDIGIRDGGAAVLGDLSSATAKVIDAEQRLARTIRVDTNIEK